MGERGPPATPSAIKQRRGTARADVKREPKPKSGSIRLPAHLSARAKTVWRNLLPELERLQLATDVDVGSLERYCSALAEWRTLDSYLNKNGLVHTVMMSTGIEKEEARPEVALRHLAHTVCLQIERQFGLTPSARVRLVTNVPDEPEETEEGKKARERASFMKTAGPLKLSRA